MDGKNPISTAAQPAERQCRGEAEAIADQEARIVHTLDHGPVNPSEVYRLHGLRLILGITADSIRLYPLDPP